MTTNQENLKELLQKAKYKSRKRVGNKWVYTYDEPKGKQTDQKASTQADDSDKSKNLTEHYKKNIVARSLHDFKENINNAKNEREAQFWQNRYAVQLSDYSKTTGLSKKDIETLIVKYFGKDSKKQVAKATDAQVKLSSILKADSKSKKSVEVATKHPNKLGAGAAKRKKLKKPEDKVAAVMKEFKNGTLHSGSGEIVTDVKQAKAIAMSEAGLSKAQVDLQFELLKAKPVESKEILKEKPMTKATDAQNKLMDLLK